MADGRKRKRKRRVIGYRLSVEWARKQGSGEENTNAEHRTAEEEAGRRGFGVSFLRFDIGSSALDVRCSLFVLFVLEFKSWRRGLGRREKRWLGQIGGKLPPPPRNPQELFSLPLVLISDSFPGMENWRAADGPTSPSQRLKKQRKESLSLMVIPPLSSPACGSRRMT